MTFEDACKLLSDKINELDPETITPNWIYNNASSSYRYFYKHSKCSLGYVDWDKITRSLPYEHQKKWQRVRCRRKTKVDNNSELEQLLNEYRDTLYVFVLAEKREDRIQRDCIAIRFVRLAQNGNEVAREYIYDLLYSMVCDWIRDYKSLWVLNGYNDIIEKQIHGCIRRFRYAGSFTTYLYSTLQYASLGLRSLECFSLDEPYRDGNRSRLDLVVKNEDTGDIKIFSA